MRVIYNGIAETRLGDFFRQPAVPHPFGKPEALRLRAQALAKPLRQQIHLSQCIPIRQHGEDRLIVSPAQHLHLARRHEFHQPVQKRRLFLFEPVKQGPGIVQGHPHGWMRLQHVKERPIAPVVRKTKDMVEISHRLVVMNAEQQRNRFHTLHIVASKVWSGTARTSG